QADLRAFVGHGERVRRGGGAGDVDEARAAVALPLIGVAVAHAVPRAARGGERAAADRRAGDRRLGGDRGRRRGHRPDGVARRGGRAVGVARLDDHAHAGEFVGRDERVRRGGGAGDVGEAGAGIALPLVGVGVADAVPAAAGGGERRGALRRAG